MRSAAFAIATLALACGTGPSGQATADASTSSGTSTAATGTTAVGVDATTTTSSLPGSSEGGEVSSTGDDTTGGASTATLEVHWIDTEGGAATLFVTPGGSLVLVDAGFPGARDADRIAAVVQDQLGRDHIDLCIVTHYHVDHVGGVPDLVTRVPVTAFWDHGDSVEAGSFDGQQLWQDYLAVADGKRTIVAPGEVHDVDGLEITIVSAATEVLAAALPGAGASNPHCDGAQQMPPAADENGNSIGFVARFGDFELLDLGDLTWSFEDQLACRLQNIGTVDLYQTTHHGLSISGAPQLVHALDPVVVVMNNGPHKGGDAVTFERIAAIPSMPELWAQHRALGNDDAHNAVQERTANLEDGDGDQGFAITAIVDASGSITVTNERNGHARTYASH
ncbi:MAG: MBL fold metallo-hydrolase [Deltaproteobacteria bacterium]|nr:MBL fold metallo-hydrolase [Deltaproteobacteria bacterium]MBK8720135.1 MBL fold metallo-hydrolase [Deltaproteobacteria bacterium]MBP7289061.1 MBL fold metallo-hydrolase [Nannocystaceae bacterium]